MNLSKSHSLRQSSEIKDAAGKSNGSGDGRHKQQNLEITFQSTQFFQPNNLA